MKPMKPMKATTTKETKEIKETKEMRVEEDKLGLSCAKLSSSLAS